MKYWLGGLLVLLLGFHAGEVLALKDSQTAKHLQEAREALALGEMKKWEGALKKADAAFKREKEKMSLSERNNHRLWITLFWSKYHQFRGNLPAVKNVTDFESKQALQAHIKKFEQSVGYLKKGIAFLRSYNLMYMQIARRSNLQNQLYLQASLSLERDLEGTIRQGQIYIALLRFAEQNWENKKKTQQRFQSQKAALEKLRAQQGRASLERASLRKEQKKFAKVVKLAQKNYVQTNLRLRRQAITSIALFWTGLGISVVGLGVLGTGAVLLIHLEVDSTSVIIGVGDPTDKQYYSRSRVYQLQIGTIMSAVGGGVLALGLATLITAIAINPGLREEDKAVLNSHNKYLEQERERQKKTSLRWPGVGWGQRGFQARLSP